MKKKILFVGNSEIVIYKFRKELIEEMVIQGFDVRVAFPTIKNNNSKFFDELGVVHYDVSIDRRGKNPFKDISLIKRLQFIIRDFNPDIVLGYTIKPNIYLGYLSKKK